MTEQRLLSRTGRNVHPAAVRALRAIACEPGVSDEEMAAVPVGGTDGTGDFQLRNSRPPVVGTKSHRPPTLLP